MQPHRRQPIRLPRPWDSPLVLAQGSPIFHSSCEGKLGVALESLQGWELLIVPLRTQGYCGVGMGLSGLHWVWCNGRGPHLEWTQPRESFFNAS